MSEQWKRERVSLATKSGDHIRHAQADTYRGIAVHRMTDDFDSWAVTHIASGLAIVHCIRDEAAAKDCAREVLKMGADWTLNEAGIKKTAGELGLRDKVARLKEIWENLE